MLGPSSPRVIHEKDPTFLSRQINREDLLLEVLLLFRARKRTNPSQTQHQVHVTVLITSIRMVWAGCSQAWEGLTKDKS